jgi:hypothetical protein
MKLYKEAYPEVGPHCHLRISMHPVDGISVFVPRRDSNSPTTGTGDLARVVQTQEATQDSVWLSLASGAGKGKILPGAARQV